MDILVWIFYKLRKKIEGIESKADKQKYQILSNIYEILVFSLEKSPIISASPTKRVKAVMKLIPKEKKTQSSRRITSGFALGI